MELKSHKDFVNEMLVGQYSYYGQGSLYPLIKKLADEGKTPSMIYQYMTQLGIDEERKRKVLAQVFESAIDFDAIQEGLFEEDDEIDDLVKADPDDLAKGIEPEKAKADPDVEDALDKLKKGDEEEMEDKKDDEDSMKKDDEDSAKLAALKAAMKDSEKLEKIKKILMESYENELNEMKKPKSWDTMFAMNAIKAYEEGEFDPEDDKSLAEWEKEYNGGRPPKPRFETYDIIAWALGTGKKPDGSPMKEK